MYQNTNTFIAGSSAVFNTFGSQPNPTAHITKSRGRLKAYGQTVYLKDGSNFEIELHNPKTTSVLAKIWINNQLISSAGIILRPGQRVYLERFIDDAKKFKFETYEVDDSAESASAIIANGKVKVLFYDEQSYQLNGNSSVTIWNQPWHGSSTFNPSPNLTLTSTTSSSNTAFYAASSIGVSGNNGPSGPAGVSSPASVNFHETGRIEKGGKSNQKFDSAYGNFNSWNSSTVDWQILPESKKPVEIGEIRSYCTGCGTRHKKSSWKFCPNCGTSINS